MSRSSLHSFITSSEHTAVSDRKHSLEESPPRYLDDFVSLPSEKCLPSLPHNGKSKSLEAYNPLVEEGSGASQSWTYPLTTIGQLSAVLGPDNTPHSVEIDTIPCAGVRIPQGPLTGLLAWRLVVRKGPPTKGKRTWWPPKPPMSAKEDRRKSYAVPRPTPAHVHSFSVHDENPAPRPTPARMSTISLPLIQLKAPSEPSSTPDFTPPAVLSALPHSDDLLVKGHSADGVITNFLLDTGLPYSIVSRDTLLALGYPSSRLPTASRTNPHAHDWEDDEEAAITLTIQGIKTRLRIARPGEASRLGVQFLQDAGVSLFFPKDGEGVGPVLYLESAHLLVDVPRTIPPLSNGTRLMGKLPLPQRVRTLFGLT